MTLIVPNDGDLGRVLQTMDATKHHAALGTIEERSVMLTMPLFSIMGETVDLAPVYGGWVDNQYPFLNPPYPLVIGLPV